MDGLREYIRCKLISELRLLCSVDESYSFMLLSERIEYICSQIPQLGNYDITIDKDDVSINGSYKIISIEFTLSELREMKLKSINI